MRRRARHRLVGAAVLVLIGVVGFPLLFDSQPRPMAVDIPIDIPDKGKVRPLGAPALPTAPQARGVVIEEREAPAQPAASAPTPTAAPTAALTETTTAATKPEAPPEPKAATKPEPKKPQVQPAEKSVEKPVEKTPAAAKPNAKAADAAKAQALLEGKSPAEAKPAEHTGDKKPATDTGRFVVQVGAYSESAKLQEARSKVEKAGFKTYIQVVGSNDSQRTRVRIGPFATKAEAQKAADKIKKLSLPAAILEL